jgi:hypothetical protein
MSSLHGSDERRAALAPRLPLGLSVLVIAVLSVLSWAVLISLVTTLWTAL